MHRETDFTERVAVVIPIYRNEFSAFEELALKQCFRVLNKHKIIVIKPKSLNLTILREYDFIDFISFDDHYFENIQGYNALMLWEGFYEKFLEYQYIMIHQLDAFVFKDSLIEWCDKNYDYVGAPWLRPHKYGDWIKTIKSQLLIYIHTRFNIKQKGSDLPTDIQLENKVGNGGLSLRKVRKFYETAKLHKTAVLRYLERSENYFNEDVWWSVELNRKKKILKIPGYKEALYFSFENAPARAFELTNHQLPFGCHAWNRCMSFWKGKIVTENTAVQKRKTTPSFIPPYNYEVRLNVAEMDKIELVTEDQSNNQA